MNKRGFCKITAAAGAALGMAPSFSIGKPGMSANSKVNIGWMGVDGIGQFELKVSLNWFSD